MNMVSNYFYKTASNTFGESGSVLESASISNSLRDPASTVITSPMVILAGESIKIPYWIRGDKIGTQTVKFLFRYHSDVNL